MLVNARDSLAAKLLTTETCLPSDGTINHSRTERKKYIAVVRPIGLRVVPAHKEADMGVGCFLVHC